MVKILDTPTCQHCGSSNVKLRRYIISNGTSQISWRCLDCNRWAEKIRMSISYDIILGILRKWGKVLKDLPIAEDRSSDTPCVVCGAPGEYHHWAPSAWNIRFGEEWNKWPCSYLCPKHHHLWHAIVTPTLTKFVEPEKEEL
jgi:hypothetical protein